MITSVWNNLITSSGINILELKDWTSKTIWNREESPDFNSNFFTIHNLSETDDTTFTLSITPSTKNPDLFVLPELYYKVNTDSKWSKVNSNDTDFTIPSSGFILFYGDNPEGLSVYNQGKGDIIRNVSFKSFKTGSDIKLSGNILSFLNKNINSISKIPAYSFNKLFYYTGSLKTYNLDASELIIGRTDLGTGGAVCYYMFYNNKNLTLVPLMPILNIGGREYSYMFYGCTGLTSLPEKLLPATTLAESCYWCMFSGCSNITNAPELPATNLYKSSYWLLFYNCKKLNCIKCNVLYGDSKGTTAATIYGNSWVEGVAATGTFYKNPNLTMGTGTSLIPTGWVVKDIFEEEFKPNEEKFLKFTNVGTDDYGVIFFDVDLSDEGHYVSKFPNNMYYKTSYDKVWTRCDEDSISANEGILIPPGESVIFYGDTTTAPSNEDRFGTFGVGTLTKAGAKIKVSGLLDMLMYGGGKTPASNMTPYQFAGLFKNNTFITDASELVLPSEGLSENCFESMFEGCKNLESAPNLEATILAAYCYLGMFAGCSNLTTLGTFKAEYVAYSCCYRMFEKCTSLETAYSVLSAEKYNPYTDEFGLSYRREGCFAYMFSGCTKLKKSPDIKIKDVNITGEDFEYMFKGCSSLNSVRVNRKCPIYGNKWLLGVAQNGTFYCPVWDSSGTVTRGDDCVPTGWFIYLETEVW